MLPGLLHPLPSLDVIGHGCVDLRPLIHHAVGGVRQNDGAIETVQCGRGGVWPGVRREFRRIGCSPAH